MKRHFSLFILAIIRLSQGSPQNNNVKAIVSMYDGKNKRPQLGNFVMSKVAE
jgi:hypothetical protein